MSNLAISVHETDIEKHAANAISGYLKNNADKFVLFFVSGGSALKILDHINFAVFGKNITVSLLDERFSRDGEVSNFLQLTNTKFYKKAKEHGITFISSLPEEGESLESVSDRWEKELRDWKEIHPLGLTIAIMGIGFDGHTAGIMPFPENSNKFHELFENKEKWIVPYDAGDKNKHPIRMTTSVSFLKEEIDYVAIYVSGESKMEILKEVISSREIVKYPASVLHLMREVQLFIDFHVES